MREDHARRHPKSVPKMNPPETLWAKTGRDGMWLTLETHMTDTLAAARIIWDRLLPDHVRALSDERAYLFCAAVHDIGKCSPAFQGLPSGPTPIKGLADPIHHSLVGRYALERAGLPEPYAQVVGAHHGFAPDWAQLDDMTDGLAEDMEGGPAWQARRERLIRMCARHAGFDPDNPPKLAGTPRLVLMAGLVAMADWMASSLPLAPTGTPVESSEQRMARWFKDNPLPGPWTPNPNPTFEDTFGIRPRPFQQAMLDTARRMDEPDVLFCEAPMGEGKTEAAMLAAQTLTARLHMGGVYYALPTAATADAMLGRVRHWLGGEPVRLCHAGAVQPEDLPDWLHRPDTGVLTPCCVGTIDQLLMVGARHRQAALRHAAFAGKTVILDEVHACDEHMRSYLTETMAWLGAYHVPVIVCSATLTGTLRKRLYDAWHEGAGDRKTLPMLEPAVSRVASTGVDGRPVKSGRHTTVAIRHGSDDVTAEIRALMADGHRRVCVVRDTVARAVADYMRLKAAMPGLPVILDHGRYTVHDRARHDMTVVESFGRDGVAEGVCVATQVVEQSLDVDFDAMITDVAPMDLLLQRMGRIHRHPRGRRPDALLIVDTPHVARLVYDDWPIRHALDLLPRHIILPDDIAGLTEAMWTPDGTSECAEWLRKRTMMGRKALAGRCLPPTAGFDDWLAGRHDRARVRDIEDGVNLILAHDGWHDDITLPARLLKTVDVDNLPADLHRPWMRVLDLTDRPGLYSHELGWTG